MISIKKPLETFVLEAPAASSMLFPYLLDKLRSTRVDLHPAGVQLVLYLGVHTSARMHLQESHKVITAMLSAPEISAGHST